MSDSTISRLESLFGLHGKVVLLTGATGGIGRAMAELFAEAGATLVLTSNEASACAELAAELAARGYRVLSVPCELRDPLALKALVTRAMEEFGRIEPIEVAAAALYLASAAGAFVTGQTLVVDGGTLISDGN